MDLFFFAFNLFTLDKTPKLFKITVFEFRKLGLPNREMCFRSPHHKKESYRLSVHWYHCWKVGCQYTNPTCLFVHMPFVKDYQKTIQSWCNFSEEQSPHITLHKIKDLTIMRQSLMSRRFHKIHKLKVFHGFSITRWYPGSSVRELQPMSMVNRNLPTKSRITETPMRGKEFLDCSCIFPFIDIIAVQCQCSQIPRNNL